MSGRKYYCYCDANCKFETMTKEQILTAIAQAVESGEIHDVDAGFVTKVKENNAGGYITFWVGTQAQYNALKEKDHAHCMYIITDHYSNAEVTQSLKQLEAHADDKNNPHGVTAEQLDLVDWCKIGVSIPANSDLNNYTAYGKYVCSENNSKTLINSPIGNDGFTMFTFGRASKSVTQVIIGYAGGLYIRTSTSGGSFSKDWLQFTNTKTTLRATESSSNVGCYYRTADDETEWYNPPMVVGREYRTTEQSEGKVVYAKRVSYTFTQEIGNSSSSADYDISHGISASAFGGLVRCFVSDGFAYPFPYYTTSGGCISLKSVDENGIHLRAYKATMSARTLYFDVYYTKA